jgi:hypothetical protein
VTGYNTHNQMTHDEAQLHQCTAACFPTAIYDSEDRDRCIRTLFVTGGLALGWHLHHRQLFNFRSHFNDIDLAVESKENLPTELCERYLVSHYHPQTPRGKLLIQLADTTTKARIDVFILEDSDVAARSIQAFLGTHNVFILSIEDLSVRFIQQMWRIFSGKKAEPKYKEKLEQAMPLIAPELFQAAWNKVRLADQPQQPYDAINMIEEYVAANRDCLQTVTYSQNLEGKCLNCVDSLQYPLAEKRSIYELWGYV